MSYRKKLEGAIIGRFAGCALGAPVELMELGELKNFAKSIDHSFPPTYYWKEAPNGKGPRYKVGKGDDFTSRLMKFLSTDDDITYTILSLLIMEEKGFDFTVEDVADFWQKYLPIECTFTAERTTLQNLNKGIPALEAGIVNNNEQEYIGAAIRIDGYGYVAPGNPELAVSLAYKDAILSHRDSGLHSAIYFTALISLAFTTNDIDLAMEEALAFIPDTSEFYKEISWAISIKDQIADYQEANRLVTERYVDMSWVHAINNACLTIWGIHMGKEDFDKGISETVAMAYDNDCTAATVGSVLGAYLGIDAIAPKWYKPWNNRILSYLNGIEEFALDDIINRFYALGMTLK